MSISATLHATVVLFAMMGTPSVPSGVPQAEAPGSLSVDFLGEREARYRVTAAAPVQHSVQAGPMSQAVQPNLAELSARMPPNEELSVARHDQGASPSLPSQGSQAPMHPAKAGLVPAQVEQDALLSLPPYAREHGYIMALREAVRAQWAPRIGPCSITIHQAAGGRVITAVSESCAMGEDGRQSLEIAAIAAQPLPYAGFEHAFREWITLDMSL